MNHLYYGHSHTGIYKQEYILKFLCQLVFSHLSPSEAATVVLCPDFVLILESGCRTETAQD